ncbi:APC family permease [Gordonia sp. TBRC 11910]|uniref:APC family permease n=1 Tax=Gordonia asplenii TaxID=2725283 RepID=A0A848KXY3_9ACTN|nr:APC family permease [Gordonia asplenii]NMO03510.1 APC family permease [Gordonia asplenii]
MTQQRADQPARVGSDLDRTLGVPQIVFMVVAMAAPLTVFAGLIPLMLGTGNGIGTPVDFVIVGVVLGLFTVGYSAMTPEVRNAGAFYSYIQRGLGTTVGLGAAALAVVTYTLLMVAVSAYLGAAASNVVQTFAGASVPWWIPAAIGLAAIGFLGYRNVELSARVLGVLLVAEIAIVLVVDLAIVLRGGADGLTAKPLTVDAFTGGATGTGIMFAVFGFVGFEATAVFRSEAKDPDRTIPRATYIAVALIAVIYAFSSWAMIVGLGVDHAVQAAADDPEGLASGLAAQFVGKAAHDVVQVLLVTSFFACVLTAHNVVSRYLFSLGRQRALPRVLGEVHPVHRSPSAASLVTSAVVTVVLAAMAIVGLDPVVEIYGWFGGAGTLGLIVLLTLASLAVVVHFRGASRRPASIGPARQRSRRPASIGAARGRSRRPVSLWAGTIAPTIAFACLATILALVVGNFELLIGSRWGADVFLAIIALAFVGGLGWALALRRTRPDVFQAIE